MNNNTTHSSPLMDSYESSEVALMDSFKAAALTVTTLYKDSLIQNRKAYVSGYHQALQDLYEFISSHPTSTMACQQQDTTMSSADEVLPVQDLLTYARQRNNQLTSEMDMDPSLSLSSTAFSAPEHPQQQPSASSTHMSPTSIDTNLRSRQEVFSSNTDSQPYQLGDTESSAIATTVDDRMDTAAAATAATAATTTTRGSGGIGVTVKNAFHPFQIDPGSQFTFSLPVDEYPSRHNNSSNTTADHRNYNHHHRNRNHHHHHHHHYQYYHQGTNADNDLFNNGTSNNNDHSEDMNQDDGDMNNLHHGNTFSTTTKRRFTQQELAFMGRTLNHMNIDSTWNEPPFKRRSKKDDLM